MSTSQGCKFCIRHGLPILPVRPAVVAKDDALPHLPASIMVPAEAQGETAWTGRLLRGGFLYIWAESGKRWINYFVTSEGYYYPLPESGDVPPDIVNGKVKPCITQPAELASASLITLPVKPKGMKNGLFWFCWSEVAWTDAVRKMHEDASYRSQYMQRFDMDTWINSGQSEQMLPLAKLPETVAEYSSKASSCKIKEWSPTPWKKAKPMEASHLLQAADKLYPDKGAMILLQDPPAVLQDLSALINYELQKEIYEEPTYQRELVLSSTIDGLKTSVIRQLERDYIDDSVSRERLAIYGATGLNRSGDLDDNMFSFIHDAKMKSTVAQQWAEYEQYYDPEKVAEFQEKFKGILTEYNNRIAIPREKMYLTCIKSEVLLHYFQHNFDSEALSSGIDYVQTINYCIAGMQDKLGASRYFQALLVGKPSDVSNILARALVLNQTTVANKLEEAVKGNVELLTLSWAGLADVVNTSIARNKEGTAGVMGTFFGLLTGPIVAKLQTAASSSEVFHVVASMGAFSNKAIITYEKTGTHKQFVKEVVTQLAKDSGLNGRVNADRLRHYVTKELRRLKIDGLPMEGKEVKRFLVMVDIEKVQELHSLPAKARAIALTKLLRLTGDVQAEQFTRWQGAVQRGMSRAGQAMPFMLGVISGILQITALCKTANYEKSKLTDDQLEATARYWAGVAALGSTIAGAIETGIKDFNLFSQAGSRFRLLSSKTFLSTIKGTGRLLGIGAGAVTVLLDLYHVIDESLKGHYGIAFVYSVSASAGVWLTIAMVTTLALPVFGTFIAAVLLIGTALYLAIYDQNQIQKWLEQCLWRRIPVNKKDTPERQEKQRKYIEAGSPVWPTMKMEMDELKLALGEG